MTSQTHVPHRAPIRRYTQLIVWQKAMTLVTVVYQRSSALPPAERFGIVQQLRRAAVSIPSNIAEGHGRMTNGEFIRFLTIARGSLQETETLLQLSVRLGFQEQEEIVEAMNLSDEVSRMLAVLTRTLGRKAKKS